MALGGRRSGGDEMYGTCKSHLPGADDGLEHKMAWQHVALLAAKVRVHGQKTVGEKYCAVAENQQSAILFSILKSHE